MSDETTAIAINGVQDGGEKPKLAQTPSPAAIISELRGAIDWHPNGTPGPWNQMFHDLTVRTSNRACEYPASNICTVTAARKPVRTAIINARAIAEVPAMVMALRELDSTWREFFPDGPDGKYGLVSIGAEHAAAWRNICAILSRIDGGAA